MSEHDYEHILGEIHNVKLNLHDLEGKIDDIEKEIKMEMEMKIQKTEWEHREYDRRITLTEKIVFSAVGIILLSFMGAVIATVIK